MRMDVNTRDGIVDIYVSADPRSGAVYVGAQINSRGATQIPKLTAEEARRLAALLEQAAAKIDNA